MCWEKIIPSLVTGIIAIIAALLAAKFALFSYFKQKEYELVKQRYLDNGIDKIASVLELNLNNLRYNWARTLHLIKQYREYNEHFDKKELTKGFGCRSFLTKGKIIKTIRYKNIIEKIGPKMIDMG